MHLVEVAITRTNWEEGGRPVYPLPVEMINTQVRSCITVISWRAQRSKYSFLYREESILLNFTYAVWIIQEEGEALL